MRKIKMANITEYLEVRDPKPLFEFLRGHLYIEFALNLIINRALKTIKGKEPSTFKRKIDFLANYKIIDKNMEKLLSSINNIRNKLAHQLDYEMTFEDIFNLLQLSAVAGVDYSDEQIYLSEENCKKEYDIIGMICELSVNTFYQLLWNNEKYFDENELLTYMS